MADGAGGFTVRSRQPLESNASLLIAGSSLVVVAVLVLLVLFLNRTRCSRRVRAPQSEVGPTMQQSDATAVPIVMLVNVRSGGGRGVHVLSSCQKVAFPPEAYALSREGLVDAVRRLLVLRASGAQPRVVCAGGDGTVTAVVRTLLERGLSSVPVAVLPLGTGNDMARTLGSTAPRVGLLFFCVGISQFVPYFQRARLQSFDPETMALWLHSVRAGRCVQADVFSVAFDVWPGGSILSVRDKTETQLAGVYVNAEIASLRVTYS